MRLWGLHIVDVLIVAGYLLGILYIGKLISKKVKGQTDFYLAGRKLGKLYQFFLNFGQATNAEGAVSVSSVVYRQGVSGVWIALQTLFMTPYYWFMNKWFRRVRLVTVADLFEDRFGGRSLAAMFAGFKILAAMTVIAFGYLVSYKILDAMLVKAPEDYTEAESRMVADYREFTRLRSAYAEGGLTQEQLGRYEVLKSLYNKGELSSHVSYVNPVAFYAIYGSIVGCYVILGGFGAAVVTDAFQAILIMVFSFILIPFGLFRLGGFGGLHASVPDYMFRMFGSSATSEYTWYSMLAILFTSTVQIHAVDGNMAVAGSAKDEFAARMGAVTGTFGKRFMIICWSLCGLIAVGLFGTGISDADTAWGVLTKELLGPGLIGLMLVGVLAANMSTLDAYSVNLSALFTRNLYMPVFSGRSERHYVLVGRAAIVVLLVLGALTALRMTSVITMAKFIIAMNVTFGAPIFLLFFWRRLTKSAVIIEVIACTIVIVILPWVVPAIDTLSRSEELTVRTYARSVELETRATKADVEEGLAEEVGQMIVKRHTIEPVGCFFEKVAHVDPYDSDSPLEGVGRFNAEVFIVSKLGVDVRKMTPAMLLTTRFVFDGVFPFVLLFIFSYVTKPTQKERLDRFYVKMKTEVQPTPEQDEAELEKSYAQPGRFDDRKMFRKSSWEFGRWNRVDTVGFILCWVVVAGILGVLWLVLNVGR